MKKRVLSFALAATMTAALFAGCTQQGGNNPTSAPTQGDNNQTVAPSQGDNNEPEDLSALNGTYDIVVWVSESDGVTDLTQKQIDEFCKLHSGIVINAQIEGISESNSASNMITDVENGADLYCFAQDQLTRLVEAGALAKLGQGAADKVKNSNDNSSVLAASVAGDLYCYPMTSDNGYFMFYDKSVVSADHIDDLAAIVKDCEDAGKMFSMEAETSAWYTASFFFGTGCTSSWTTDTEGKFTSVSDDFNSEAGLAAMKGMQILVKSPAYTSSSKATDFAAAVPSAVVVAGTWESAAAKQALGDNYAVADLPSFTVDGKTYHMGSYSGCKLMGVKPQTDANKGAVLQKLAAYLTNAENQLARFELVGWGPSNKEAQANDVVKADPALAALGAQADYAIPQGNIHGSWWDIGKTLGTSAKDAADDDALKAALEQYEKDINALFTMSEEEMNAWSVIGSFDETGWNVDLAMESDGNGTWTVTHDFVAGDEFKLRMGASWDVNFGLDGDDAVLDGPNITVDEDGTYTITLVYNPDGDSTITVELQ